MSFPSPDYVASFVKQKMQKRKSDETTLLDNIDIESQGNTVGHHEKAEGFQITRQVGGGEGSRTPQQKTDSRTPLYPGTNQRYGAAGEGHKATLKLTNIENDISLSGNSTGIFPSEENLAVSESSRRYDDSEAESEHCHEDSEARDLRDDRNRKRALKKLVIATVLCFLFMCGEVIGGYFANSLAIMTDASHMLTDVSSFLVSIIALQMAAKPSSKSMTFGWHRAEVIGAITSVLTIWVVTGVLVYLAVMRIINHEYELDGKAMLITASCAVGFNIIMGLLLHEKGDGHSHHGHSHHGHSHGHSAEEQSGESGNVNVRAAFIHVLGDLLQSLGVLIAALIIYFKPDYKIADPICTFLFSVLVLATTITILRDTIVILMEGTPASINYENVKEKLLEIPGVIAVHDLRIWSLTLNQCVMSCHLAVDKSMKSGVILRQATRTMKAVYNFHSMTIQIEAYSMVMDDCKKCKPKS